MKKIALLMAILLVVVPLNANAAATRRSIIIKPGIAFSGTTATCTVSITGNSMKDEIDLVAILWQGNVCIATWETSSNGYVNFSKTKTVTKGKEYTLTADVTINGQVQPTMSFSKICE